MTEYNVFENLDILCDDAWDKGELELQLDDDSTDLNLTQEDKKKGNTKKTKEKKSNKTVVPTEQPKVTKKNVENQVIEPNIATPPQKTGRATRSRKNNAQQAAAPINVPTVETAITPVVNSTRKRNRRSVQSSMQSAPAPSQSRRGRKRSRGATSASRENSIQDNTIMEAIQMALARCADLSRTRGVMSLRRRVLAERAARMQPVDSIDLVSSPMVPVQGFVNLDSDEEFETGVLKKKDDLPAKTNDVADYDEENPELDIKIMWNDKMETYKLRKYQKFIHLMQKLSEAHDCPIDQIACNIENHIILKDDTAASIDLKSYQIIYARAMSSELTAITLTDKKLSKKQRNPNQISLKIQSDKWKKPLHVDIGKKEKFVVIYVKCAEELNVPRSNIKLSFDGDELPADETPEMLEFEGGEAIDLRVID